MNLMKIDQFTHWSFAHDCKVSPDGKWVVFQVTRPNLEKNTYETNLWSYCPEREELRPLTASDRDGAFLFLDDGSLLFQSSRALKDAEDKPQPNRTRYWTIRPDGGEAQYAFTVELTVTELKALGNGQFVLSGFEDFDRSADWTEIEELPFWFNGRGYTSGLRTGLYLFDSIRAKRLETEKEKRSTEPADKNQKGEQLAQGILSRLTAEREDVAAWALSADRRRVAFSGASYAQLMPLHTHIFTIELADRSRCQLTKTPLLVGFVAFDEADSDLLFFSGAAGEAHGINEDPQLYSASCSDKTIRRISPEGFDYSLGGSVNSDSRFGGGNIIKATENGLLFLTTCGDQAILQRLSRGVVSPVLQGLDAVECFDTHGDDLYFIALTGLNLPELFVSSGGQIKQLTHFSDALSEIALSPVQTFEFESNGTALCGYVIAPTDYEPGKSYPALLEIHGGPKTVFGRVLHHEMQMLAAEGFFVLFTNPHGSDGYGVDYSDIRGKYGTIDYEDLMTFVDEALVRFPDIDAERLGVLGGSYGGFMTNWIIGHTDRFKAANAQRSISNWISFYGVSDIGFYFTEDQTQANPWDDLEGCWNQSPLKYVQNVTTPTLFIHSDADLRCPLEQGQQMYAGLVRRGIEARLVVFKDETHELSRSGRPKSRIKRLTEIRDWFVKHLNPSHEK
ncbi:MAG: S9 family peptidase [Ndongobacter sp.]|nr:S9 family peptidase [Ndongobacter sp.]